VRFIAWHGVYFMGHHSCVGRNISLVVKFLVGHCPATLREGRRGQWLFFHTFSMTSLTGDKLLTANFLLEIIMLHEGRYCLSRGVHFFNI
jgi:hypothetical protein